MGNIEMGWLSKIKKELGRTHRLNVMAGRCMNPHVSREERDAWSKWVDSGDKEDFIAISTALYRHRKKQEWMAEVKNELY